MDEREVLVLGALLHDVGKFVIRAQESSEGKDHSQWGREWLECFVEKGLPPAATTFAELHHGRYFAELEKSNLTLIVYQADNIAAAVDREKDKPGVYDHRHTPLMSIFSRVALSPMKRSNEEYRFHKLTPISENIPYPQTRSIVVIDQKVYSDLLENFEAEFSHWLEKNPSLNPLLVLLEKFWSFIPSETKRVENDYSTYPDISLFDHAKVTASVSNCLYNYFTEYYPDRFRNSIMKKDILDNQHKYFALLGADISGVQKFIYTISSKGALKTLRARSFFLELFTEHVVAEILDAFKLSRANLIYSGGGHFYLLTPNWKDLKERIDRISSRINQWLLEEYKQKLYLTLSFISLSGNDLSSDTIGHKWSELGKHLSREKSRKFLPMLPSLFEPQEPKDPLENCAICHEDEKEIANWEIFGESLRLCDSCYNLFKLGDQLIDCDRIIKRKVSESKEREGLLLPNLDGSFTNYYFLEKPHPEADLAYLINKWKVGDYNPGNPAPIFLGQYVRTVKDLPDPARNKEPDNKATLNSTASFAGLAAAARGSPRIGVLRMDVDNLGRVFTTGLEKERRTFSTLTVLSRSFNLFFKYYINQICYRQMNGPSSLDISEEKDGGRGRNVSIVYSGGDDLFLVGAWDEVTEVAFDIYRSFKLYTAENQDVNISGGIVVQKGDYPLYLLAELAGQAEEEAKEAPKKEKDSITLFFNPNLREKRGGAENKIKQVFRWKEAEEEVIKFVNLFKSLGHTDQGKNAFIPMLSQGLIHRLFAVFEEWENKGTLYIPRMAYIYSRLKKELNKKVDDPLLEELRLDLMNPTKIVNLRTALIWIELLSRARKEGDRNAKRKEAIQKG